MSEVIWDCPNCKTENRDLTDETATPICSRCDIEHDWPDLDVHNLALFEIYESGEATGSVHHYCSESCRLADKKSLSDNHSVGSSRDAIEGEQCAHCGIDL